MRPAKSETIACDCMSDKMETLPKVQRQNTQCKWEGKATKKETCADASGKSNRVRMRCERQKQTCADASDKRKRVRMRAREQLSLGMCTACGAGGARAPALPPPRPRVVMPFWSAEAWQRLGVVIRYVGIGRVGMRFVKIRCETMRQSRRHLEGTNDGLWQDLPSTPISPTSASSPPVCVASPRS
jgi:hypothetical protein